MDSIQVKNLTKSYNGLKAVDNISFTVKKGSIFAFLGPNGAGKSTSIKMFTSLLKPDKGSIRIEGIDAIKNRNAVRKKFGIVFQDPSIDEELTAYENLVFHAVLYGVTKDREKRIKEALRIVGLTEKKHNLVKTFSGGMKRRLEIGRSFVHRPDVLFLDEPTTGLDPQTRNAIWEHINMLNKEHNMTIFLTTHYMPEAEEVAEEIAIIDHGAIIAKGTLKELQKKMDVTSLEEIFLKLTGKDLRDEHASGVDQMRISRRMHR
ncbi:MAG: ATP-binding cassette domain-containing protein [Candidatus Woesearchaeota archaeon]